MFCQSGSVCFSVLHSRPQSCKYAVTEEWGRLTHAFVYAHRCCTHTWLEDHSAVVFHHVASPHNITTLGTSGLYGGDNGDSSAAPGACVCCGSNIRPSGDVNHDITLSDFFKHVVISSKGDKMLASICGCCLYLIKTKLSAAKTNFNEAASKYCISLVHHQSPTIWSVLLRFAVVINKAGRWVISNSRSWRSSIINVLIYKLL